MSSLQFGTIRRVHQDGRVWDTPLQSGINLLIGQQNTSKTTTLRIMDFCLGDEKSATSKFGITIAQDYSRFELELLVNGTAHLLTRRLHEPRQRTMTDVDGSLLTPIEFNHWLMTELDWPLIEIPKGLGADATELYPLTIRSLYRHIYRKADSWTAFASQEFEYYRQGVTAFFLGIAEAKYGAQKLRVRGNRIQSRLSQVEEQQRQLTSLLDDLIKQTTFGFSGESRTGVSSLGHLADQIAHQVAQLHAERDSLAAVMKTQPGYEAEQDTLLEAKNLEVARLSVEIQDLAQIVSEQKNLSETLEGDRLRLLRAIASNTALRSIVVTACPACFQAVTPPIGGVPLSGSECYVCKKHVAGDVSDRRLQLEKQVVENEKVELDDTTAQLEEELQRLREVHNGLLVERETLLSEIESQRNEFISPLLREFERIQFQLGQLNQQKEVLKQLTTFQGRIADLEKEKYALAAELDSLEAEASAIQGGHGVVMERAALLTDAMNRFVEQLPLTDGLGGVISLEPQSLTFYIGSEVWDRAIGDERRVLFFLAYHYAWMRLAADDVSPYPGLCVLDNPFQQDLDSAVVDSGLHQFQNLCQLHSELQVVITTRRPLETLEANRIPFGEVFNTESDAAHN